MARVLKFSNRFTVYRSYPIELEFGRMIIVISPHNRSESGFSICPTGQCRGAPLDIFKSIHSLHFYPIELKLFRMILDDSSLDLSEPDSPIFLQRALLGSAC